MTDELRRAIEVHKEICDLFDAYMLADDEDGSTATVDAHEALFHRFINGGESAMHALADFASAHLGCSTITDQQKVIPDDH